jgi:hypothetical protein
MNIAALDTASPFLVVLDYSCNGLLTASYTAAAAWFFALTKLAHSQTCL